MEKDLENMLHWLHVLNLIEKGDDSFERISINRRVE